MIVSPKVRPSSQASSANKHKQTIGCYPVPAAHSPPPDFGPNCVPAAVARQIDAHFAQLKKEKKGKIVEANARPNKSDASQETENFSLCIPQNPSRFSSSNVQDTNHPRPSLLQNPQRIVADGPFAVNEAVKPNIVTVDFDGLQPLRIHKASVSTEAKKTLKDLQLLVQASLRSRNIKDEASAYFNIGLLYENEGLLKKANEFYSKYLQTLGADADPLVFNRIAVNLQLMRQYDEAIEWNMKHLSFSRSLFETIAANCNIALIYKEIGNNSKSVEFYKAALETATEMNESEDSPFYEQISKIRTSLNDQIELAESESKVNYIGTAQLSSQSFGDRLKSTDINKRQIDAEEEYLENQARIAKEQGDLSTAFSAMISSGKLNCVYGNFERSEKYYENALEIAQQIGSSDLINHVKVAIGIVNGNKQLKMFGLFDEVGVPDPSLFSKKTGA